MLSSNKSVNDICRDIVSIGLRCRNSNISKVFISSIAYSSKINTVLVQRLNRALYDECRQNGFVIVDKTIAVTENDLWVDRIHLQESGKRIIANDLINNFNFFFFFRIFESTQVVPMKEKLLLSEFESVTQNTLDANKECYSERRLRDQSEKKSINTIPNSLKLQSCKFKYAD